MKRLIKKMKWKENQMDNETLYHYGMPKRSGRYPYGSGKRPFQSGGGVTGFLKTRKQKKQEKVIEEKKRSNLEKARTIRAERKLHEEAKAKALREGTATEVLRYKSELTTKELQDACTRIEWTQKLQNQASREVNSAMRKVDNAVNAVKTVNGWTKVGIDTYNTMAQLYNVTENGKKNPLPYVDKGNKGDKDKKKG